MHTVLPWAAVVFCLVVASTAASASDRLMRRAMRLFDPIEVPAVESSDAAALELGKRLFIDPILSAGGARACVTCHELGKKAGTDGQIVPEGAQGLTLRRNTPSVYNVALSDWYFWDGRSDDLTAMLAEHLVDPSILGFSDADSYRKVLEGRGIEPKSVVTSLAVYLRSLITPSRFDAYLGGNTTALNEMERAGLKLFLKSSCNKCHDGAGVGGTSRERLGEHGSYANQQDQGLFEYTGDDADRMVFKAPALRNVALTGPYFHDGEVSSLEEAVELMARLQQDVRLSEAEIRAIVVFLGALNGTALDP